MESVKNIYNEVTGGRSYNEDYANLHFRELMAKKVKAKEIPEIEESFIKEFDKGVCLNISLCLISKFHKYGYKAYLSVTRNKNPDTDEIINHASVCYIENGNKFIADPVATIRDGKENCFGISIQEFAKQEGPVFIYDMYGEYRNLMFFGDFMKYPIEVIDA